MLREALAELVARRPLDAPRMAACFEEIFEGRATPAQVGAFLVALRMKGETPEEIASAAEVMRRFATRVRPPPGRIVLDTCGTGGDGAKTFNISTAVSFVAAAAGVVVAKHGNRSVSSSCGSADVLAALGVTVDAPVARVEKCLEKIGIGFLFAPSLHGVMKHAAGPRREIGVRSIFNLLGPLSNPAGATHQLLGVYDGALVEVLAHTLLRLGARRALVVHGEDGLDEVSPCAPTRAALVSEGRVSALRITPEEVGISRMPPEAIRGGSPEENATALREVLDGRPGPHLEAVVLNAAAAIWVAEGAETLAEAGQVARGVIESGEARRKLDQLVALTCAEGATKEAS